MILTGRFNDAFLYAARLHAGQFRKGSPETPYLSHLMGVASLVIEYGGSEDQAVAALLHDAVEDQGGLPILEQIRAQFGGPVAQLVSECTDSFSIPKLPWRQRKEAYIAGLPEISKEARLISIADKVHNVRSLVMDYHVSGEALWAAFKGGREGTLWYYRAITGAYQSILSHPLLDILDRAVLELETLCAHRGN